MDIKDLIKSAVDQKPAEFADNFNSLIVDKIKTAVDNRKQELAQNMFIDTEESNIEVNSEEESEENA